jgi:GT2 family glycosyltransferase
MTGREVTILCATVNSHDAVRLTLLSLRRFTPTACRVLVADNGSRDGTLEFLKSLPWVDLVTVEQRCRMDGRKRATAKYIMHGLTLDWLAARVKTPYFVTLDSDVEFLRPGWLADMLVVLRRDKALAVGEFEAGIGGYRPRLAPHVLLVDAKQFRAIGGSFVSFVRIGERREARRWVRTPMGFVLDEAEQATYRSGAFYSTGAALFERVLERGSQWVQTPRPIRKKYRHFGHMSWAHDAAGYRAAHDNKLRLIRKRLAGYVRPNARSGRPFE